MIGSDISVDEVVEGAGVERGQLDAVLAEEKSVDAGMDLRLARYFGVSEGFFLGLQADFDLEEARRAHRDELAKISRRSS